MNRVFLFVVAATLFVACKDSQQAQFRAMGKPHIITLYGADGKEINKWESTGSVSNEEHSDGWYFEDVKTRKLVEITGTIVIEVK